jgi:hypothetical protein
MESTLGAMLAGTEAIASPLLTGVERHLVDELTASLRKGDPLNASAAEAAYVASAFAVAEERALALLDPSVGDLEPNSSSLPRTTSHRVRVPLAPRAIA